MRDDGPRLEAHVEELTPAPCRQGGSPPVPAEVVRRACQGDKDAQNVVFQEYTAPLERFASGRLPPYARGMTDTQDVVQDVFVSTARQLPRIDVREDGALLAYLRRAVRHRIIDEIRRVARRPTAAGLPEDCPAPGLSPLERAIRLQNDRRINEAMCDLAPRDRLIVVLRLRRGLSYEEIGMRIGAPTSNAARVATRRAVVRLAEILQATPNPSL